jgi:RNA polymerase sigma factor (sigma-70 family)
LRPAAELDDPAAGATDRMDILVALGTLSPRQRACVVLRFYEDRQVADIADLLGCSTGSVKRYLNEALGHLRIRLEVS